MMPSAMVTANASVATTRSGVMSGAAGNGAAGVSMACAVAAVACAVIVTLSTLATLGRDSGAGTVIASGGKMGVSALIALIASAGIARDCIIGVLADMAAAGVCIGAIVA